jgi:hypothetical protein
MTNLAATVTSWSPLGPYRVRRFKSFRAARWFVLIRRIFYIMPHGFQTWATIEEVGSS